MKALVIQPDASVNLENLPEPILESEDGVIARTLGCGLCGTDLLKMNLKLLTKPTVLGHEWVGIVETTGAKTKDYKKGDLIIAAHHVPCEKCSFCLHGNESMCAQFKNTNFKPGGFAEKIFLSESHLQNVTFKLPRDMPWQEALLTEPLACCVRGLNQLNLRASDTVILVGLGSIGLMIATLLKLRDVKVIGLDLDENRRKNSVQFGVSESFKFPESDFEEFLRKNSSHNGADGVIFTAGPASLLNKSMRWIRDGGFINLFSHLSGERAEIDTAELYHREIRIISTYSSSPSTLREAFAILRDNKINLRRLFAPAYSPENFHQAVTDVNSRRILKALIEF